MIYLLECKQQCLLFSTKEVVKILADKNAVFIIAKENYDCISLRKTFYNTSWMLEIAYEKKVFFDILFCATEMILDEIEVNIFQCILKLSAYMSELNLFLPRASAK